MVTLGAEMTRFERISVMFASCAVLIVRSQTRAHGQRLRPRATNNEVRAGAGGTL